MEKAPEILTSRFLEDLLAANQGQLAGFRRWVLKLGMLFGAREQWWGGQRRRPTPHEGLDLCCFEDAAGRQRRLAAGTRIPATFAGLIIRIAPDFLGESVYLSHEIYSPEGLKLHTLFGHLKPRPALKVGGEVAAGEIIGTISEGPDGPKAPIAPHLHITLAWLPALLAPERLDWPNLGRDPAITLIDPRRILSLPT
jgi:murein DD-endopeptidase MepM/ murein hydrolase activator NlpD